MRVQAGDLIAHCCGRRAADGDPGQIREVAGYGLPGTDRNLLSTTRHRPNFEHIAQVGVYSVDSSGNGRACIGFRYAGVHPIAIGISAVPLWRYCHPVAVASAVQVRIACPTVVWRYWYPVMSVSLGSVQERITSVTASLGVAVKPVGLAGAVNIVWAPLLVASGPCPPLGGRVSAANRK